MELLEALPESGRCGPRQSCGSSALRTSRRVRGLGIHQRRALIDAIDDEVGPACPSPTAAKEYVSKKPGLTVLAGPTAVGKGTVSTYIRDNYPGVWLSVSATTRTARPGEEDGVHYFFKTQRGIRSADCRRRTARMGRGPRPEPYGTLKSTVNGAIAEGRAVLLEIDLQGARQVKATVPDARSSSLRPPSWDEMVRRLVGRGTETAEEQQRRLETAKVELAAEPEFDHTVINDDVRRAADELVSLMG